MIGKCLRIAGFGLLAFGLLFLLQGAGIIHWPRESFMLDRHVWIWRGLGIAAGGGVLVLFPRRS